MIEDVSTISLVAAEARRRVRTLSVCRRLRRTWSKESEAGSMGMCAPRYTRDPEGLKLTGWGCQLASWIVKECFSVRLAGAKIQKARSFKIAKRKQKAEASAERTSACAWMERVDWPVDARSSA